MQAFEVWPWLSFLVCVLQRKRQTEIQMFEMKEKRREREEKEKEEIQMFEMKEREEKRREEKRKE